MCSKYENFNKKIFKRKDSKQTKVSLLIKDYFKKTKSLTRDKFDKFLDFIELKTIWNKKEEQNILWNSILKYSTNKKSINYDAAFKGIMDLFKEDEDEVKNKVSNNISKEEINDSFDKYIRGLNGNMELLYNIEFINNIFLDNGVVNINDNIIDNIINEINLKYKFMTINEKEIKNYLCCFNFNIKINKDLINNINTLIENTLLDQIKNNCIIFNDNSNNNSRSISFSTANDTNSKNANSFSLNNGELFDKLLALDKIIFDCMDSLIFFYKNKELITLIKKYVQNYLLITKNNIYNNLKLILENDNKTRVSDSKNSQNEENNMNNNNINNINNINNMTLETPKSKNTSKNDFIYIKKPLESGKSYSNLLNINKNKIVDNI